MTDHEIATAAARNTARARKVLQATKIVPLWESIGATVNPVGSFSMGLLVKHLDLDFHLYTPTIEIEKGLLGDGQDWPPTLRSEGSSTGICSQPRSVVSNGMPGMRPTTGSFGSWI